MIYNVLLISAAIVNHIKNVKLTPNRIHTIHKRILRNRSEVKAFSWNVFAFAQSALGRWHPVCADAAGAVEAAGLWGSFPPWRGSHAASVWAFWITGSRRWWDSARIPPCRNVWPARIPPPPPSPGTRPDSAGASNLRLQLETWNDYITQDFFFYY